MPLVDLDQRIGPAGEHHRAGMVGEGGDCFAQRERDDDRHQLRLYKTSSIGRAVAIERPAGGLPDPTKEWDPRAGDRAVARYQRALRLAKEFGELADDGSHVTPW